MSKRVSRVCKWCGHKVTFDVEKHDKHIYNKAIDDFAEKLCDLTNEKSTNVYFDGMFCDILTLDNITDLIFMIAEQLKEGVDNGT